MTEHPNVARVRAGYAAFSARDFAALDDLFSADVVFHVGARNPLAGGYRGRAAVYGFFAELAKVTGGTFGLHVHAILADDEHAAVLLTASGSRHGKQITTNDVHVYHLHDGMITEFWDASTDQYASDELLGGPAAGDRR